MEAKNKALEVDLSAEKQMRQDKEQEVGQFSTSLLKFAIAITPTR